MKRLALSDEARHERRLAQKRASQQRHAAKESVRKKRFRTEHQEHSRKLGREQVKKWKQKNPERTKEAALKHRFGISLSDYKKLLKAQDGHCAICPATTAHPKTKYLAVDHDHATKAVRGLLCGRHNVGLGYFQDNKELLLKAAEYLGRTK